LHNGYRKDITMAVSVFDLFSIGVGPSSSHTIGPMRAARQFVVLLQEKNLLAKVVLLKTELYGSLALTGHGHGTDKAILLGLSGEKPEEVDPATIEPLVAQIRTTGQISLLGKKTISFIETDQVLFYKTQTLPHHSNGMRFTAIDADGHTLLSGEYYSVGGGFVVEAATFTHPEDVHITLQQTNALPFPFKTAAQLLKHCEDHQLTIRDVMWQNERNWRNDADIRQGLLRIWHVMKDCIERGCVNHGILPGVLKVKRRAPNLYEKLMEEKKAGHVFDLKKMQPADKL